MKKGIDSIELSESDIAIVGCIVIAIVSLLHITLISLFVVLPVVLTLLSKLILVEIKNHKEKKNNYIE